MRIDEIFRQIALLDGTEPDWRRAPVDTEIARIKATIKDVSLGPRSLLRLRFGEPNDDDRAALRRAADLQIRWGLALMRTGDVNQRVWGAQRLQEAAALAPASPLPVLVLAGYLEIAGYSSGAQDLLDGWARVHGPNDVVDLQRMRRRERVWQVERDRDALQDALNLGWEIAGRHGGWPAAPAWLNLEHSRLQLQADSLRAAETSARLALRTGPDPALHDDLSHAQAELLLGLALVRKMDYANADEHFGRALRFASREPALAGLVSWMEVPWDLWSRPERWEFDRNPDRAAWVDQWWRNRDPILATPQLLENRLEYYRRVGEAWFTLSGVDAAVPGPITDPGQLILRYGCPDEWTYLTGSPALVSDSGPSSALPDGRRAIRYVYRLPGRNPSAREVLFPANVSGTAFSMQDSLRGPTWPDWLPRYGFEAHDDRLNTSAETMRRPDGGVRLVFCYDTWLPEYSVRYPLQGFRFNGEAKVHLTLTRPRKGTPGLLREEDLVLEHESVAPGDWPMRRRSGTLVMDLQDTGTLRLATQLTLSDRGGRVVAMAVDNGRDFSVTPFAPTSLDASSVMLLATLPDTLDPRQERRISSDCLAIGPDLMRSRLVLRADQDFLPGEELAFYLEVYNLSLNDGATDVELSVTVERLNQYGQIEYSVGTRGPTMELTHAGIAQWNIARSLGLVSFEPGSYRLRINVYDRQAERRVERLVPFRVETAKQVLDRCGWDRLPAPDDAAEGPQSD